ncbi:MAG: hypothetical protein IPK35_07945 [Saprospiraceae bacterium]|jgi:hypothetical protein|nr:hypothetical protein [Saprospiraceae bacterium]
MIHSASGYIALSLLMNVILFLIGTSSIQSTFTNPAQRKSKKVTLLVGLVLWQIYILIIGKSGILQDFSLPPRVLIFLVFPAFVFIAAFLIANRNKAWIHNIPPHWLIFCQTFRIAIESLFVLSVAKGILPEIVTIKGYNFDMIFACTAPIVGYYVVRKNLYYQSMALLWNYLGLGVIASIIFLFVTAIYFPQLYGRETSLFPKEFGLYPYPLVPGFLMPSAVFMHVLSILQLMKIKEKF